MLTARLSSPANLILSITALTIILLATGCRPEPTMHDGPSEESENHDAAHAEPATANMRTAQARPPLAGRVVAILIAEGFHDKETTQPRDFLTERGATVIFIGTERGEVSAYNSDQRLLVQQTVHEVRPNDFHGLVIPGGKAPALLIQNDAAVRFVGDFVRSGKTVAAICHGPELLIAANVVNGRTLTAAPDLADKIRDAGGSYSDQAVIHQGNLITSRGPQDLQQFTQTIGEALR